MAKDPLKIIGKPDPTPAEREQANALAVATGRPAKMCRAALLEAGGNDDKAKALLDDPTFIKLNTDFDIGEVMRLASSGDIAAAMTYMNRQEAMHSGQPERDVSAEIKELEKVSKAYAEAQKYIDAEEAARERLKGSTLDDPILGRLTYDYFWEGSVDVPMFGRMSLSVDTGGEGDKVGQHPDERQRAAFSAFIAAASNLHRQTEAANWAYFERVRDVYETGRWKRRSPKASSELWKHLEDPGIFIPPQDEPGWRLQLNWNCSWDEEHGHAVYIVDARVTNVSIQGDDYEPYEPAQDDEVDS